MKKIKIYSDGGCSGNPGPGGWAYVVVDNDSIVAEQSGGENPTTNNRMELSAVINAISDLKAEYGDSFEAEIYTDSQYVKNGITSWIINWEKNGWKTAAKKPVKNADLWKQLRALDLSSSVSWHWVKGHAGNEFNEHCDQLLKKHF